MNETVTTTDRHNIPRGGNGKFIADIDTARRDSQACILRRDGHTYDEIATQLGYADRSVAYNAVQRALLSVVKDAAEELRTLELERLDYLWKRVVQVLERRHYTVQIGKVISVTDEYGNKVMLQDDGPVLAAVDRLLKIQERRAKLLGLDAPKQIEIITLDAIQAEIRRLEESMGVQERSISQAP
jgi:hypothetical protein